MDKTVKVELSAGGIDAAIREIEAYQAELAARNAEFVETLAQEGKNTVDANYPNGKTVSEKGIESGSDSSHSMHTDVTSSKTKATADMVVEGSELLFIEFGSGVHYNGAAGTSPHPLGTYTIGSYGAGHGKQDIWGYKDNGGTVLTHGTRAEMPVYKAYVEMKEIWKSIARQVFG